MEFFDRVPTYPGRVRLTPVPGQTGIYDMERADEPLVVGTPVDKALFEGIANEIEVIQRNVNDSLFAIAQRTALENIAVGTVIGLYENGVITPFIKLADNYNSSGRALVVRKDCVALGTWREEGDVYYNGSRVDDWLNNVYSAYLDGATQSVVTATEIIASGASGNVYLDKRFFLLSMTEYNIGSTSGLPTEGYVLSYFNSNERRMTNYNGVPVGHWTRTLNYSNTLVAYAAENGTYNTGNPDTLALGIRPAFTLPLGFEVTVGVPSTANTMATAEVI